MTPIRPDDAIADLHRCLTRTVGMLSSHLPQGGGCSEVRHAIDESRRVLDRAVYAGVMEEDRLRTSRDGSFLPVDDDRLPFSDSRIDLDVIQAGIEQLERIRADQANYVPGVTTDWDDGMIAVAVYRAMTRQARLQTWSARVDPDDRDAIVHVQAVDAEHAAETVALARFEEWQGEWMGGTILVASDEVDAADLEARGVRIDVTVEFDQERDGDAYVVSKRLRPRAEAKPARTKSPAPDESGSDGTTVRLASQSTRDFLGRADALLGDRSQASRTALSARRFRALMHADGLPAGSAGFDPATGVRTRAHTPGAVHFGGEVSTVFHSDHGADWTRGAFRALAEDMMAVDDMIVPTLPVGESIEEDASRWDALMRLPRIKVWRHNGIDGPDGPTIDGDDFVFYAEYWTHGVEQPGAQDDPVVGRRCLTLLADALALRHDV